MNRFISAALLAAMLLGGGTIGSRAQDFKPTLVCKSPDQPTFHAAYPGVATSFWSCDEADFSNVMPDPVEPPNYTKAINEAVLGSTTNGWVTTTTPTFTVTVPKTSITLGDGTVVIYPGNETVTIKPGATYDTQTVDIGN